MSGSSERAMSFVTGRAMTNALSSDPGANGFGWTLGMTLRRLWVARATIASSIEAAIWNDGVCPSVRVRTILLRGSLGAKRFVSLGLEQDGFRSTRTRRCERPPGQARGAAIQGNNA